MAVVYVLLSSAFGAFALVNLERRLHLRFMKECYEGKIKKQNFDRFVLSLISVLVHAPPE
jgi:hypothetical protein